ncbi:MAG: hypothetical protein ABIL62_03325 [Planctomycetota bacterium]
MTGNTEQHVFVVDDELKVLEAIGETLGSLDIEATCFVPPSRCLQRCTLKNAIYLLLI